MKWKPLNELRILEIGDVSYFHNVLPQQTDRVWSSRYKAVKKKVEHSSFTPAMALRLCRALRARKYDLIVLSPLSTRLWRPSRWFGRNIFDIAKKLLLNFEFFGPYWVLWFKRAETPAVVLDIADTMIIRPENFWMFPYINAYFKRELPQNNWHAFLFTTDKNEDVSNIRRQKQFHAAMAKVRPFPLVIQRERLDPAWFPEKEFDVFYVGDNPKTTVRMRGLETLKRLAQKGYRVDLPNGRIDSKEFSKRCDRAWLVWSPEGSGWDCGRHYESLIHGAVPVMNYPTIERYQPLIDTEHCFFYGPEGDDLLRVMEKALRDKEALRQMVRQGRDHLNRHYHWTTLVDYILSEADRLEPKGLRIF